MLSQRLLTTFVVALTLPVAIYICRGRTIEMPRHQPVPAALLAIRLKEHSILQAQRRESAYAIRLHKRSGIGIGIGIGSRERV